MPRDDNGKVTLDDNGAQRRRNDAITLATSKSSSSDTVRRRAKQEQPKTLSWDDLVDPDIDKTQPRANESLQSRIIDISEDEIDIDPDDLKDTGDPKNVDKIVVEKILAKQRGEEVIDVNGKPFYKVPVKSPPSVSVQLGKDVLGIEDDEEPHLEDGEFDVDDEDDKEYDVDDLHVEDEEDETPITLTRIKDASKPSKPQLEGRSVKHMESRFAELMSRANTLTAGGPDGPSMPMPRLGGAVTEMGGVHAPQRSPDDGTIMNVREWTSQFKYTAEQEYVRIQREHPAVYAGYSAKGWLCDAYESFDESYLANVWGGGTYRLTAFQGVDRSRPSATGVVVINGVPKAYRGSDGNPVPFPEVPNPGGLPGLNRPPPATNQQNQHGMMNGQMQMPIAGMPFVSQMSPMGAFGVANANPGMSAADVLALAKQASEDSASRNQNHLAFDAINKMTQQFQEQQSRTVDVVSESAQKLIEPLQRTIEMYKATLEENQRKHASELDALYRQHQLNLDRVREDFKAQNDATRLQYDQMLTQSRNDATSRENANREQAVARENYAREQYNFNVQALTRELENIRSSRVTELESLRNQLTLDATAREARATETAKMFYEGRISALQEQLRSVESLSNTRITDIKESGNIQLSMTQQMQSNLLSSKDMEINRLQSELNMVRMEVGELRDKSDPLKAIAGAVSFKKQFDELTGNVPPPPVVEEEPKNFLGMLAKYGPSINSNLIAPVMDPVKKAIDAAKQDTETKVEMQRLALQQRQQEIDVRQMVMNQQQQQQAYQQAQQAQQAAINEQFRAGQLQTTVPVVAPVPVPQPRPQTVTPVQPQPQTEPQAQAIEGHDQETEKNLIEFLSNALDNNATIPDIMGQISMGRTLGVISDTTYQAFMEVPERDIVETLKASAIALGKTRLASPRGEKFLYDILKELRSGK